MLKKAICFISIFYITLYAHAKEQGKIECYDRSIREQRSETFFTLDDSQNKNIILTQKGRGDYDYHRNVTWELNSTLESRGGIYYPLSSERIIKSRDGRTIKELHLYYNYKQKVINFTVITPNITIKKRFPIKGITVDGTNVLLVTSKLVEYKQNYFYLLTDLGNLYKINMKNLGEENALYHSKRIKAIRIKLTPDLGILDDFLGSAMPCSYAWYSNDKPCRWLRYEGKELDRDSRDIINFIRN